MHNGFIYFLIDTDIYNYTCNYNKEEIDMTKNFENVIRELQSDTQSISRFLSNPEKFLKNKGLTKLEKEALLTRDIQQLEHLGVEVDTAVGALSGAHSQRCGNGNKRLSSL
jgi:hypothetical protein